MAPPDGGTGLTVARFQAPTPWRAALVAAIRMGVDAASATGRRPVLALSGGRTPQAYLPALIRAPLPWPDLTVTLADDRRVARSLAASNLGLLDRAFRIRHPARRPRLTPLAATLAPPDVAVLGMGGDGHTASVFPGLPRRPGPTPHTEILRRPEDPYDRITLSLGTLAATPLVIVMLAGSDKVALWNRIAAGDTEARALPMARLLAARERPTLALLLASDQT